MKTAGDVERALNDIRLAVLGILVTIGLSVGFGVPGPWWCQILAGVGAVAVVCAAIRWLEHPLMTVMHWLTGR
jgi:hypothetical protein